MKSPNSYAASAIVEIKIWSSGLLANTVSFFMLESNSNANIIISDTFYLTSETELMKDIAKIDDRLHDLVTMSDVETVSYSSVNKSSK